MGAEKFTMGVDVGSTASKCLILKNGREILGSAAIPAGTGRLISENTPETGGTGLEKARFFWYNPSLPL